MEEKQEKKVRITKAKVYFVFENGDIAPFSKEKAVENVKYIGLYHCGHIIGITLKDAGKYRLFKEGVRCPEESPFYRETECEAMFDRDFFDRTRFIQKVGTDIPLDDLAADIPQNERSFLPSLPVLAGIRANAGEINEALEFVGGQPFNMEATYWSCTLHMPGSAWCVNFKKGYMENSKWGRYGTEHTVRLVKAVY